MHPCSFSQSIDPVAVWINLDLVRAQNRKTPGDALQANPQLVQRQLVERPRPVAFRDLGGLVIVFCQIPETHRLDAESHRKSRKGFEMQAVLVVQAAEKIKLGRPIECRGTNEIYIGDDLAHIDMPP